MKKEICEEKVVFCLI